MMLVKGCMTSLINGSETEAIPFENANYLGDFGCV